MTTPALPSRSVDRGRIAYRPGMTAAERQEVDDAIAMAVPAESEQVQAEGRPPTREERETAATAIRTMQAALAPSVDALYDTPAGMDVLEAFNHLGRAADAVQYAFPGATGLAQAELTAAVELLRNAAGRSTQAALALNPIAAQTDQAIAAVSTWPVTHAGAQEPQAFTSSDARLVLTPIDGGYILSDNGNEVARFAAEGDALEAVAGYALPADDPAAGTPFNVFLAPEGFESGDGRLLELGTTTWREPPMALMFQDTAAHGPGDPGAAWFAGAIEQAYRDPADASRIMGRGHLAPGADGERAEAAIRAGLRGVSIDGIGQLPPTEQITAVGSDGQPLTALLRYSGTKIMGATVVPHPAFEPCCIWFDDEPVPERVTATHGQQIPMDVQPEVIDTGDPLAALVASGGGPVKPPREWFYAPAPAKYQPVSVRADGFISGHLGPVGTCHIGIAGKCETIPASATGYRYFHRTTALSAEGEKVACGWLTCNTGHESTRMGTTAATAMAHYDNTGTQVAKVRVIDTQHGPWMCGAVAPGLDEQTLWRLQGPDVSGDWRDIDGYHRELVAALAVPLPGFMPKPRPEALVASGRIVAQTGTLPCDDCGPSPLVQELELDISAQLDAIAILDRHDQALRALRPQVMAAIHEKVSPSEMVEAARKAAESDPAQAWRDKLRV